MKCSVCSGSFESKENNCVVCGAELCELCFELDSDNAAPNTPLCLDCYLLNQDHEEVAIFLRAIDRQGLEIKALEGQVARLLDAVPSAGERV